MRNVTWIFGTPRGAGGMPVSSKRARLRLSAAILRSPWRTWIGTKLWLSTLVVKISLFSVGIVVLRGMSAVKTPPPVSTPSESGVTSRRSTSTFSSLERRALERGARRDDLVRVHALVRLLAEELLHRLLHRRHARHAADEDDVVDVRRRELRVGERLAARLERPLDEVAGEHLELGAGQRLDDVERLAPARSGR